MAIMFNTDCHYADMKHKICLAPMMYLKNLSEGHLVENGNHNYKFDDMWLSPGKNNTIK